MVRIGRPDLLAVDEKMIALVFAARAQACEIGAGAWFGIALAPADFAAHDFGQMLALLLLIAVFEHDGTQHRNAERGQRVARLDAAEFLVEDARFLRREPAAAILFRPCRRSPAACGHTVEPELRIGIFISGPAAAPGH